MNKNTRRLSNADAKNPTASFHGRILLGTDFSVLFCTIYPEFQDTDHDGPFLTANLNCALQNVSIIRTMAS